MDFGDVVHQGACAGCWAYSTAAVVEAARFVADGRGAPRSVRAHRLRRLDRGCATGNMASAYAIQTSEYGMPPLGRYPKMSASGKCDVNQGLGASLGAFSEDGREAKDDDDSYDSYDAYDAGDSSTGSTRARASLGTSSSLFGRRTAMSGKNKNGVATRKDGTPVEIPTGNARAKGYCDLPVLHADAEAQLLRALAQQPVAVGVNIHALQFYESGIVHLADCPPAASDPLKAINHAAVLRLGATRSRGGTTGGCGTPTATAGARRDTRGWRSGATRRRGSARARCIRRGTTRWWAT